MSTVKIFGGIIGLLLLGWIVFPQHVQPHMVYAALITNLFFSFFIHNQNRSIMATNEQFEALLTRIDNSTNGIAQQLRDLKDQLANQGLPKELEDAILAKLETAAAKLEAVGKEDPSLPGESESDNTDDGNQG